MHLHLHLKECVENYGSIHGFWVFSFERYNGILGSYHKNSKSVEIQIMRKFMTSGRLYCILARTPEVINLRMICISTVLLFVW